MEAKRLMDLNNAAVAGDEEAKARCENVFLLGCFFFFFLSLLPYRKLWVGPESPHYACNAKSIYFVH